MARTIRYADPLHAGRHPFQTYMLALCVVSGIPLLFGRPTGPSMNALLPHWMAVSWGASLAAGAAIGLIGSYMPRASYATALTVERIGLLLAGSAAVVYGMCLAFGVGLPAALSASITLGFGFSALVRSRDIGKVMSRAQARIEGDPIGHVEREGEALANHLRAEFEAEGDTE